MFEKRPNYVGNDVDLWEMSQICGKMTELFEKNFLKMWKMT